MAADSSVSHLFSISGVPESVDNAANRLFIRVNFNPSRVSNARKSTQRVTAVNIHLRFLSIVVLDKPTKKEQSDNHAYDNIQKEFLFAIHLVRVHNSHTFLGNAPDIITPATDTT